MFAPPPELNTITICTNKIEEMEDFYLCTLGMAFVRKNQGNGLRVLEYNNNGFVFRLKEVLAEVLATQNLEMNFLFYGVEALKKDPKLSRIIIDKQSIITEELLVIDPQGNHLKLIEAETENGGK